MLLVTQVIELIDQCLLNRTPCAFQIGCLALQVALLRGKPLDVALGNADQRIQFGQFTGLDAIHLPHAAVQAQQLCIGGGLELVGFGLANLLGRRCGRYDLYYPATAIKHFVAFGDIVGRHALGIDHRHTAAINVAIQADFRRVGGLSDQGRKRAKSQPQPQNA
ncbi:Phosphoribosylamine-glycine ligase [Pseudomonas syringae pv. actinidiae]|uniref:Phosphoribosylamine-glycine ligase n=1 Tax=Pseudomonas syringae pv. actinidiae TaxID=103796 RepID=A0A2V0Q8Q3_PSESF|nr:Phosphoribosylamine-glycine ligase [Pseudomonas syringae pv. actinidiae]